MLIAQEDGAPLRGDMVLSVTQRYDLTPIPSTLEAVIRADSLASSKIGDGSVLRAGPRLERYRVVKVERGQGGAAQHRGGSVDALKLTALPEQFMALALPLVRAVVKYGRSFGDVYRSCGATCPIGSDVGAHRFACLAGHFPTINIARVMHEEAIAAVWAADGRLHFRRYVDLFAPRPVTELTDDAARSVESSFLERHEVPTAYSVDASGAIVNGNTDESRRKVFVPRADARILQGMTRCLMVRRTVDGGYAGEVRAGDVVAVGGVRYVVSTAAHHFENGSSSVASQTSRLWLAQLEG